MRRSVDNETGTLRLQAAILVIVLVAYAVLAVASALAKAPWWDEAWFASPAINLLTTGSMATTILEPTGFLQGIDRYTYWILPLYPVTLAGWFGLVGVGLLQMRLLSIAWGLVALTSWFFVMKALSRQTTVALLAVACVALDYDFITMS
jgi:hypothetical protein